MSRRTKTTGFGSLDTEQAMKLFVKGAETTMDMSASAQDHMERGDCRNAATFAFRAAEEAGAVRGVMTQVAAEVAETNREIQRVGKRPELVEQKSQLQNVLGIMREDFDFLQKAREQSFNAFARRCACGTRGSNAPTQVTTQPSDGEDDG